MAATTRVLSHAFLLGLIALSSACVVRTGGGGEGAREQGYREGYYDREHSRYYHEHAWHDCREHDENCH